MKFVILLLCTFVNICLLFLPYKSFCADHQYEVCKKGSYCGNQSIQFPFYINETTGYCGYLGFKLNCINNNVLLFINEHIWSLVQSASDILSKQFSKCFWRFECKQWFLRPCQNSQLIFAKWWSAWATEHFKSNLVIELCTLKSGEIFFKYKVGCDLRKIDADWVLAMKVKDRNISHATDTCNTVVMAPVHDYSEDGDTDYMKLIRNGFDLRWMATNCSNCEASGGICGYEVSKFKCFYKDRPHTGACLGKSL